MGKGGIVLGLISLLIGAGGLGFGFINYINQSTRSTEPTGPTLYYVYRDIEFQPGSVGIYIPIPDMSIVIDIDSPVSLHILFTCSARCLGDAVSFSDLIFYFMINNVRQIDWPWARTGGYESNTNYEYSTVSLQHYFTLTTPGTYNITVTVLTESVGNFIRQSSLWIESYPA